MSRLIAPALWDALGSAAKAGDDMTDASRQLVALESVARAARRFGTEDVRVFGPSDRDLDSMRRALDRLARSRAETERP